MDKVIKNWLSILTVVLCTQWHAAIPTFRVGQIYASLIIYATCSFVPSLTSSNLQRFIESNAE